MRLGKAPFRTFAALILAGVAVRAWGLATTLGPDGLGASALGAGGAVVALAQGPDGLYWNPAARLDGPWDLAYNLGSGGPAGTLQQGLALMGPLDEGVSGAFLAQDDLFPRSNDAHEDNVAADLSVQLGPWVSLGTQQRLDLANPGGLAGWSMDLGAEARIPLAGTWNLDLGLSGTDLLSQLNWSDGLVEQQPAVLRAGAAVEAAPGSWLAFEEDQQEIAGAPGTDQWRVGAQASLWRQSLDVRIGATQAQGNVLYYSAGLGVRWSRVQGMEGDYAVLIPSASTGSAAPAALRQALSLSWSFGSDGAGRPAESAVAKPRAVLARSFTDAQGRLRWARISLAGAPIHAKAWSLRLLDRQGRVLKIFRGTGPLPKGLDWDGRDAQGLPVSPDGLEFSLRVTDASGALIRSRALLAPVAETAMGSGDLDGEGDFALRTGSPSPLRPVLHLRGAAALAVAGADFDLSVVPGGASATGWELRIVDASGRTVRVLRGMGRPPKSVRWDGDDDLGRPVADSLGAGFELRLRDVTGATRVVAAGPLASQDSFDQALALRAPAPPAAAGLLRGNGAAPDARISGQETGRPVFTFYFAPGSAELTLSDRALLEEAAARIRRAGLRAVSVSGFSGQEGASDFDAALSQARADAVLKALLADGLDLDEARSRGWGDSKPAQKGASAAARAMNRRVELEW